MGPRAPQQMFEDRPRGILSEADREYLLGMKSYSNEQSERDARYRIRERIKNSILDFSILLQNLDGKDRRQIFASQNAPDITETEDITKNDIQVIAERAMFLHGIEDAISFFYLGLDDISQSFEPVLENSIEESETIKGTDVDEIRVEIDIHVKQPDLTNLIQQFEAGEEISESNLKKLINSDAIEFNSKTLDQIFEQISMDIPEDSDQSPLDEFTEKSDADE